MSVRAGIGWSSIQRRPTYSYPWMSPNGCLLGVAPFRAAQSVFIGFDPNSRRANCCAFNQIWYGVTICGSQKTLSRMI